MEKDMTMDVEKFKELSEEIVNMWWLSGGVDDKDLLQLEDFIHNLQSSAEEMNEALEEAYSNTSSVTKAMEDEFDDAMNSLGVRIVETEDKG